MPTVNNPYVNPVDLANTAPKYHASQHSKGGFDPLTPADIGAAPADHSHDTPSTISWQNVTDKPDEFAPSPHAATHGSDGGDPIVLDASQIASGIVPLERLPHGCLERLVIVANDEARFALTTAQVQQGDTVKVESTQMMYFVVDESKLNSPDGYVAYTAGAASAVDWSAVTGKPSTFEPSLHAATHASGGSDPITPASIGAAAANHTHSGVIQNVTAVYSPVSGSSYSTRFNQGAIILPMIPGVMYSGNLRCQAVSSRASLLFMTAGFDLISREVLEPEYATTVSIPNGTCCVINQRTSDGVQADYMDVYEHTVTYQ